MAFAGIGVEQQQQQIIRRRRSENLDRFIPNRSASGFHLITQSPKPEGGAATSPPPPSPYQTLLADVFDINRPIFRFKDNPPSPQIPFPGIPVPRPSLAKLIPKTPQKTKDLPGILDHTQLVEWSNSNIIAVALGNEVFLLHASNDLVSDLMSLENQEPVQSLSWAPDGRTLAIGTRNSQLQLWDTSNSLHLRTLQLPRSTSQSSLAWKDDYILTTGRHDGLIFNVDIRIPQPIIHTYTRHRGYQVCGLKWSSSGLLASSGGDKLIHIWDQSMASSTRYLHRFQDHTAAVKGLAWSPFHRNLLSSGGSATDGCIKFWNTTTGVSLNSVYTDSPVYSLLWSNRERGQLFSSHGSPNNQLTLWKYPSMLEITQLKGHTAAPRFMAQSPDGCTVASAAGYPDESLKFWNVFATPLETPKLATKANPEPFPALSRIR